MPRARFIAAPMLAVLLVASGCVVDGPVAVRPRHAVAATRIDPSCRDACAKLQEDCAGAQVASTFLLIPAYLLAITGAVILSGGGGNCGSGSCGNGDFGSSLSCREANSECLRGCPLASGPAFTGPRP